MADIHQTYMKAMQEEVQSEIRSWSSSRTSYNAEDFTEFIRLWEPARVEEFSRQFTYNAFGRNFGHSQLLIRQLLNRIMRDLRKERLRETFYGLSDVCPVGGTVNSGHPTHASGHVVRFRTGPDMKIMDTKRLPANPSSPIPTYLLAAAL